ncbi:hypothetical protein BTO18_12955 [Polaribacter porphyrae]|uniref:DUF4377 domain-containing protein n=2 Tax=Polaribacter porphyrae TaxID=1137780 RepID=A0A2S7WR15_9FLAO|nr:hypothetical protein BTO18_12955 [Polaribacter porphyrae]
MSCDDDNTLASQKTITVASKTVDCIGFVSQKCLLIKDKNQQDWNYFYDTITGFTYEEGFEYEIIIAQREIENPPQDASSIETTLVSITSKIKKTSENLPN